MGQCSDCNISTSYLLRCNTTGNKKRCTECDRKAEEKYGIERDIDFSNSQYKLDVREPYVLADGPIDTLPSTWPGRYFEDGVYKVKIKTADHEKATLEAMGCHLGERGEKVGGHDLMLKGRPRIGNKVYSFIGSNRKASTCR